jgi:hypothetical protein
MDRVIPPGRVSLDRPIGVVIGIINPVERLRVIATRVTPGITVIAQITAVERTGIGHGTAHDLAGDERTLPLSV